MFGNVSKWTIAAVFASAVGSQAAVMENVSVGPLFGFDPGPGSVSTTIDNLNPNLDSDVTFDFSVLGDLNGSNEFFELTIDGVSFGLGCDKDESNDDYTSGTADVCIDGDDATTEFTLVISQLLAGSMLADGSLDIAFDYNSKVNSETSITSDLLTSGLLFPATEDFAFAAGGTLSYASVPVPAGLPLLLSGGLAMAYLGRRRRKA